MKILIALLVLFAAVSCAPKNPGFLTLVNSGIETIKVSVDGRTFTINPSNHITKEMSEGMHKITVGKEDLSANVALDKTTVFDSTGLSCYAVVDYTPRYQGKAPLIVEKFKNEKIFTTKEKLFVYLGTYLPEKIETNTKALRLQQVDCEIMDNDTELIETTANLK